jgi:hypothetical protein
MKQKIEKTPAVKAEKKNSPAGVPAAGKSGAGVPVAPKSGSAGYVEDVYSRDITLCGERESSFKVEAARCLDGYQIPEPVELVVFKSITGGDCDHGCNLSVAEARLFRDAFANAVAFVEGRPLGKVAPRRVQKLCNDGTMSVSQEIQLCAWGDSLNEVTIDVSTLGIRQGCNPHKIKYFVHRSGKEAGDGEFELTHADMRKFRVAIDSAIEFFEAENGMAGGVPAPAAGGGTGGDPVASAYGGTEIKWDNLAASPAQLELLKSRGVDVSSVRTRGEARCIIEGLVAAARAPRAGDGDTVTVPRMMAEMLWDLLFDVMESVCLPGEAEDYAGRYRNCLDCAVTGGRGTYEGYDAEIIKDAGLIHELAGLMGREGFPEPEAYVREARRKLKGAGSAGAHGKAGK